MAKGPQYVKEFDFNVKPCEYSYGGMVKKAEGGVVRKLNAVGKAPGYPKSEMIADKSSLGIKGNKNPGVKGSKPVAPPKPTLKPFAKGGRVMEKATAESYPSRRAMVKHEAMETPRMQREEVIKSASIKGAIPRRGVPVAPMEPMIGMKNGGVPKAGAYKVPKVMGEFKSGELHSGSKNGPVVKSRKQAVAIALSEARRAGKK